MSKLTASQKKTLEFFTSGADKLEKAVAGLSEKDLDYSIAPGEWTIRQIVHHVSEDGDAWSMMIKRALVTDGLFITPPKSPGNDAWGEALAHDERPIKTALELLQIHRRVIAELVTHFPDRWEQYVTYPDSKGKVTKSISVGRIIRMVAEHLIEHLATIDAIKKKHGI
jgi:hypothetical protein